MNQDNPVIDPVFGPMFDRIQPDRDLLRKVGVALDLANALQGHMILEGVPRAGWVDQAHRQLRDALSDLVGREGRAT